MARSLEVQKLVIYSDSQLVVKQLSGEYEARGVRMTKYLAEVKDKLAYFTSHSCQGVDRSDNTVADALARLATTEASSFNGSVYLEVLERPSVSRTEVLALDRLDCWLTPYITYLVDGTLPSDRILARKVKHRSSNFVLIDGETYTEGPLAPHYSNA